MSLFESDPPPPPGDGWQPIRTAPKNATWVETWNGVELVRAHHAMDLSGEDQPAYGPAWFYAVGEPRVSHMAEVTPQPTHWRP